MIPTLPSLIPPEVATMMRNIAATTTAINHIANGTTLPSAFIVESSSALKSINEHFRREREFAKMIATFAREETV